MQVGMALADFRKLGREDARCDLRATLSRSH